MKNLLALLVVVLLVACNKEQVEPVVAQQPQVFFKDDHLAVVNVKATQLGPQKVAFSFSTEYEKNLQNIEVYSGESMSLLCRIYDENKTATSLKENKYSIVEDGIKTSTHYYLIKYTTTKGDWNCSSLYKVELK